FADDLKRHAGSLLAQRRLTALRLSRLSRSAHGAAMTLSWTAAAENMPARFTKLGVASPEQIAAASGPPPSLARSGPAAEAKPGPSLYRSSRSYRGKSFSLSCSPLASSGTTRHRASHPDKSFGRPMERLMPEEPTFDRESSAEARQRSVRADDSVARDD